MKVFLERNVPKESLEQVSCNLCGSQVEKNELGYIEDHLSVKKTWGYGTRVDGETHSFDLCFDCYSEMVDKFAIPPKILEGTY